jgi:hypothetical protein
LIDRATGAGWRHRRACEYLQLAEDLAWRWYERREAGRLEDHKSGAGAVHGLLADERAAIIALFDQWGEVDRSHRKLAHRGSYEQLVWVSPATNGAACSGCKRADAAQAEAGGAFGAPPRSRPCRAPSTPTRRSPKVLPAPPTSTSPRATPARGYAR